MEAKQMQKLFAIQFVAELPHYAPQCERMLELLWPLARYNWQAKQNHNGLCHATQWCSYI